MISLNAFRITLLGLWVTSWIGMSGIVLGAERLRQDQAIGHTEQLDALATLSPLWLTPLTCLAAFWFPQSQRTEAQDEPVGAAKVFVGIAFTMPYLVIVLYLVFNVVTARYPTAGELPAGESL